MKFIARPIPMKRELKVLSLRARLPRLQNEIARPIPMKRELKDYALIGISRKEKNRKAHPDEKGTESLDDSYDIGLADLSIARPIPMKRELKVIELMRSCYRSHQYRKAHPDEKGTERD